MSKIFLQFKHKLKEIVLTILLIGTTVINVDAVSKEALTTENVNLRTVMDAKSEILTTIEKNSEIEIVQENDTWCKIKYKNKEGYSDKKYIKTIDRYASALGEVSVGYDKLNVRDSAKDTDNVLGTLTTGSSVEIIGEVGEYYEINFEGKVGYVLKKHIKVNDSNIKNLDAKKRKFVISNIHTLNMRSGPDTTYERISKVRKDAVLDVIASYPNEWIKIRYNGNIGYVSRDFVKDIKNINTLSKKVKVVDNVDTLYMRQTPSLSAKIIKELKSGQKANAIIDGSAKSGWIKIKEGNLEGYVDANYIEEYKSKENHSIKQTINDMLDNMVDKIFDFISN